MKRFLILIAALAFVVILVLFQREANRVTVILDKYWHPYYTPIDHPNWVSHRKHGELFTYFNWFHRPTVEELSNHICKIEIEMKLIPRTERAKLVAEKIIYPEHIESTGSTKMDKQEDRESKSPSHLSGKD